MKAVLSKLLPYYPGADDFTYSGVSEGIFVDGSELIVTETMMTVLTTRATCRAILLLHCISSGVAKQCEFTDIWNKFKE